MEMLEDFKNITDDFFAKAESLIAEHKEQEHNDA